MEKGTMLYHYRIEGPAPYGKGALRIAVVWNIPVACNRATADFMISSHLMHDPYERLMLDYEAYKQRLKNAA